VALYLPFSTVWMWVKRQLLLAFATVSFLARLNAIYRYAPHLWFQQSVWRWLYLHRTYSSFFSQRFSWNTIGLFADMAIVLTAIQGGLGTDGLRDDELFNGVGNGLISSASLLLALVATVEIPFVLISLRLLFLTG
jgi:hypothetical protein